MKLPVEVIERLRENTDFQMLLKMLKEDRDGYVEQVIYNVAAHDAARVVNIEALSGRVHQIDDIRNVFERGNTRQEST